MPQWLADPACNAAPHVAARFATRSQWDLNTWLERDCRSNLTISKVTETSTEANRVSGTDLEHLDSADLDEIDMIKEPSDGSSSGPFTRKILLVELRMPLMDLFVGGRGISRQ